MGTRALSKVGEFWIVTQFDGDILGETIKETKGMSVENALKHIDNTHQIRAKSTTRKGALKKYFGKEYTQEDYNTFIEYKYK